MAFHSTPTFDLAYDLVSDVALCLDGATSINSTHGLKLILRPA